MKHKQYKPGDKVVFLGLYQELFDEDYTVGKVYTVASHDMPGAKGRNVFEPSGDLRLVDEYNLDLTYMRGDNFELAEQESLPTGTGKLKVTKAQFTDRNGDKITIKRSLCRHYYMKRPGQPQQRIKKKQLSGILIGLAAAL